MKRVKFAGTDLEVSAICLGTMMFGGRTSETESVRLMHQALEAGIDFWDTAPTYNGGESERVVGQALRGNREKVFLATKVKDVLTRESIVRSCDESLRRLGTDRIDLFQIHWPVEGMSLDTITRALGDLREAGKIRYAGCSNFPAWVVCRVREVAAANGRPLLVSHQPPYNLIERGIEVELLPLCLHEKIAVLPYRPLAMGVLSGKYRKGQAVPDDSRGQEDKRPAELIARFGDAVEALVAFAEARGVPPAAAALAWVRGHPAVTSPIVGISRAAHLEQLIAHATFEITPEERDALAAAFGCEVKEEGLGAFPGWRRNLSWLRA